MSLVLGVSDAYSDNGESVSHSYFLHGLPCMMLLACLNAYSVMPTDSNRMMTVAITVLITASNTPCFKVSHVLLRIVMHVVRIVFMVLSYYVVLSFRHHWVGVTGACMLSCMGGMVILLFLLSWLVDGVFLLLASCGLWWVWCSGLAWCSLIT